MKEPVDKEQLKMAKGGNGEVVFNPSNPDEVAAVIQALEQIKQTEGESERRQIVQRLLIALQTYRHG